MARLIVELFVERPRASDLPRGIPRVRGEDSAACDLVAFRLDFRLGSKDDDQVIVEECLADGVAIMTPLPRSMRPWSTYTRLILVVVCISASICLSLSQAEAAEAAGEVADLKGAAFADAGQQRRALDKASPIFVGDRVSTGAASRLAIHLGKDTTVKLGENTQLVIDKFLPETGGEISLELQERCSSIARPEPGASRCRSEAPIH